MANRQVAHHRAWGMAMIAVLVVLTVRNTGKPDVHKRLMTLSFVPLLEAPMARPFQVLMTPPGVIAVQILCIPLSGTPAWMAIARFVESLAG